MKEPGQLIATSDMNVGDMYVKWDKSVYLVLEDGGHRVFCLDAPEEIWQNVDPEDESMRYVGRIDKMMQTMDKMSLF